MYLQIRPDHFHLQKFKNNEKSAFRENNLFFAINNTLANFLFQSHCAKRSLGNLSKSNETAWIMASNHLSEVLR